MSQQFQQQVDAWMTECFGQEVKYDKQERNRRFLEEAIELVQSAGLDAYSAQKIFDYVYARPVGDLNQEIGGTMVTLSALCSAHGIDMERAAHEEILSCEKRIPQIQAKQDQKRLAGVGMGRAIKRPV